MSLDLMDKMMLGRLTVERSVAGTELYCWPEALGGELRAAFLPGAWYAAASASDERWMKMTSDGRWWFLTTRDQLAEDVVETLRGVDRIAAADGSTGGMPSEIRWETIRRLVTAEEWGQALEAFSHGVAVSQEARRAPA